MHESECYWQSIARNANDHYQDDSSITSTPVIQMVHQDLSQFMLIPLLNYIYLRSSVEMGQCAGSHPKQLPPEMNTKSNSQDTAIKAETVTLTIDQHIEQLRNKAKKIDNSIQKSMHEAKLLLETGSDQDKREAKSKMATVGSLRKQSSDIQVRIRLLQEQKIKVQTHQLNVATISVLESVNKLMLDDPTEKLQKIRHITVENRMIQDRINQQFEGMFDEELEGDVDQLIQELEKKIQNIRKRRQVKPQSMRMHAPINNKQKMTWMPCSKNQRFDCIGLDFYRFRHRCMTPNMTAFAKLHSLDGSSDRFYFLAGKERFQLRNQSKDSQISKVSQLYKGLKLVTLLTAGCLEDDRAYSRNFVLKFRKYVQSRCARGIKFM